MTVATAPARRNVRNSDLMTGARSQHKTAARRAPNRVNPNADRNAFKTGNNRAVNPARRSRSLGNLNHNHSHARHCRPVRLAMPNHNQRVRNPEAETSAPARRARKFRPPTRARNLVGEDGGDTPKYLLMAGGKSYRDNLDEGNGRREIINFQK